MRVLLTGGYGCIGSWIVRDLLRRGDGVWIFDLKEDLHRLELVLGSDELRQAVFVRGDVTDLAGLRAAIEHHGITHVVHLAGLQVPVCRSDPLLGAKVNVLGTLAVFEAVRLAGAQVQRLVYASSAAVFGPPERYQATPLSDDVQLVPTTHYGCFKCCNEANARVYFLEHGLSSIGLRPWTVYGVGRDFGMTSEPTRAIKAVALGKPCHISYGGVQDMQFVEDVAAAFVRCLEAPYQGARSYNLRGEVVDVATFCRALCEVEPAAARLVTFGDRQLAIAYDLDDSALQRELGPIQRTSLAEGIQRTLEHFRRLRREHRLDLSDVEVH
jgi:nucleoside-diphosphate-sugar epimerase